MYPFSYCSASASSGEPPSPTVQNMKEAGFGENTDAEPAGEEHRDWSKEHKGDTHRGNSPKGTGK